jgi:chromosome segregation ATPase
VNTALDDHQDQLGKLSASETEVRSELWEVTASTRELGRLQAELNQRLVELAEQVAAPPPPPHPDAEQHRAALLDEVGELRAALAGLDDRVAEQAAALKLLEHQQQDNGAGLRAEIAKLEQDSVRLTGVVETHYHETKQALEETGRMVIQSLSEPLRDLAQAHQEADARLLELERRAEATVADVVAHNGSAEPASSGLRALEDQLDAVATAMAEISAQISEVADAGGEHASRQRELDRQTSELAGRLATLEDRLAGIETTVAEGGVQSRSRPMPADGALDLLGGLERQLRQAEGRLSKLNADAPWAPAPEG